MKKLFALFLFLFFLSACTRPGENGTLTEAVRTDPVLTEENDTERCMLDDWIDESDYSMEQTRDNSTRAKHYTHIEREMTPDEQEFVDFYDAYQADIRQLINDMCPTLETFDYDTHTPDDFTGFARRYADIHQRLDTYSLTDENTWPPEIFKMAYRDLYLKSTDLAIFFETVTREDLSSDDDPKLRHAFIQGRKAGEYSFPVDQTIGR